MEIPDNVCSVDESNECRGVLNIGDRFSFPELNIKMT